MTEFVAVPVPPSSPPAATAGLLVASGAAAMISDHGDFADLTGADTIAHISSRLDPVACHAPTLSGSADQIAALLYTSGTTGAPKGVTITLGNLLAMTDRLVHDFFRVDDTDTLLLAAPLSNVYGTALVATALRAGATLSIPAAPRPDTILEAMRRDKVTFMAGVPMVGGMMLKATGDTKNPLPDLKRVLLAGTKLDPNMANAIARRFDCEVMTGYAMTEAVPLAMMLDTAQLGGGNVGSVAKGVEMRIVDTGFAPVKPGEPGEILVRGPVVTPGYWQNDTANAAAFHDGWFRTGDIGRIDADGHLELIDRLKEIIKTAGNTVYPSEIESVLRDHPGVGEAAVIAQPHDGVGEIVVGYFTGTPELDTKALRTWCQDRLVSWKIPRRLVQVGAMPMTPSGKISKAQLRMEQGRSA